jgi:hypothetical protein
MSTTATTRIVQFLALPVVSAGIIGAAALGSAAAAHAEASYTQPRPPITAAPSVKAHPAPSAMAGRHHNGIERILTLAPAYLR